MWIRCVLIVAVLSVFGISTANANPNAKPNTSPAISAESFGKIDADANKGISLKEFMKARPNLREKAFEVIDTDANGAISLAEWDAFYATHKTDAAGSMSQAKAIKDSTSEKKAGSSEPLLIQPPKQ